MITCPRDILQKDFYLHHIFYWKGTSDFDHLLGTTRSSHPSISHPKRSDKLSSIQDMMDLARAKECFIKFRPAPYWSKQEKRNIMKD